MLAFTPEQITLVKPAADLAIKLLKPLAQTVWEWTEKATKRAQFELCFGLLDKSLRNAYQRHSYFTSLVFKNEQKKLDDYYLPLTLLKHPDNEPHLINKFPDDLFTKYQRMLIVDTAGMGKSTISKFIFLSCVRENASIPILVELRKLSKEKDIIDFIIDNTENIAGETQRDLIISLVNAGRFVFLFDGYDEISDIDRPDVIKNISEFISAAPDNWYMMTSRDEGSLSAFPNFQRFTIKPLDKNEAYQLLRLYDSSSHCAEALIEKLEDGTNANVHEFLTNPLLTSLLYKSFEFKRSIPIRKHIFYRQVFEALFETHDLMKEDYQRGKRSGLDIDQFDEFLRYFSFLTYKDGKFEYTKNELLFYIEKAKQLTANTCTISSNVVHDLTHGVPLMTEEGNYLRWVHRSMQEYFAALWVCRDSKEKQRDFLMKMYTDVKHQNLIVLCADIDPIVFRKSVVKELAIKLLEEFESRFKIRPKNISEENITERKKIVTGKLPFISNHAGLRISLIPKPAPDNIHFVFLKAITDYCTSIGHTHMSSRWGGNPCVGFITANFMLDLPQFRKLVPFIKKFDKEKVPNIDPPNLPEVLFLPIDDDPNSPVNSEDNFNKITNQLELHIDWYFDPILAKETLDRIKTEEDESNALAL